MQPELAGEVRDAGAGGMLAGPVEHRGALAGQVCRGGRRDGRPRADASPSVALAAILIAHHDPIPLLNQLAERSGGHLEVAYEERGPETWRLRLARI